MSGGTVRRGRSREHLGLDVTRADIVPGYCMGCGPPYIVYEPRRKPIEGYHLDEPGQRGEVLVELCRTCAVKLAIRILELESM